jgi:hypothetical protein
VLRPLAGGPSQSSVGSLNLPKVHGRLQALRYLNSGNNVMSDRKNQVAQLLENGQEDFSFIGPS